MTNRQKNLPPATEQAAFSQLPKKAYLCRMDFARILTERYALSDEGTGLLMQSATLTQHARKEVIIEEGQRDPDVCFVAEGSVRTYVMREDKCVIVSFSFEGDPATATLGTQPGGARRSKRWSPRSWYASRVPAWTPSSPGMSSWPTGDGAWPRSSCAATRTISPTMPGATNANSTASCCANIPS